MRRCSSGARTRRDVHLSGVRRSSEAVLTSSTWSARFGPVPGEFYFMALGGLGVSLAGFAGVIAALDRRPEAHSPIATWRIRNIVISGFTLTLAGFGIIAIHAVTREQVSLTVRIISVLLAIAVAGRMSVEMRPGPAWPSTFGWRFAVGSSLLLVIGYLASAVRGGVGLLQLMLVFHLLDPLSIFLNTARDAASGRSMETDEESAGGQS